MSTLSRFKSIRMKFYIFSMVYSYAKTQLFWFYRFCFVKLLFLSIIIRMWSAFSMYEEEDDFIHWKFGLSIQKTSFLVVVSRRVCSTLHYNISKCVCSTLFLYSNEMHKYLFKFYFRKCFYFQCVSQFYFSVQNNVSRKKTLAFFLGLHDASGLVCSCRLGAQPSLSHLGYNDPRLNYLKILCPPLLRGAHEKGSLKVRRFRLRPECIDQE